MVEKAILDRVSKILSEKLLIDVDHETDMIETGLLDSLMFVDLLLQFEQAFKLTFTLETLDLDQFRSARSIAGLIATLAAPRAISAPVTLSMQTPLELAAQPPRQSAG